LIFLAVKLVRSVSQPLPGQIKNTAFGRGFFTLTSQLVINPVTSQKVRMEFIPGPDLIRNAYVL